MKNLPWNTPTTELLRVCGELTDALALLPRTLHLIPAVERAREALEAQWAVRVRRRRERARERTRLNLAQVDLRQAIRSLFSSVDHQDRALFPSALTPELRPKATSLAGRAEALLTRLEALSAPVQAHLADDRARIREAVVRLREVIAARDAAASELRAARQREREVAQAAILVTQRTKEALERLGPELAEALWPHIPRSWRDDEADAA